MGIYSESSLTDRPHTQSLTELEVGPMYNTSCRIIKIHVI